MFLSFRNLYYLYLRAHCAYLWYPDSLGDHTHALQLFPPLFFLSFSLSRSSANVGSASSVRKGKLSENLCSDPRGGLSWRNTRLNQKSQEKKILAGLSFAETNKRERNWQQYFLTKKYEITKEIIVTDHDNIDYIVFNIDTFFKSVWLDGILLSVWEFLPEN